MKYKNIMYIFMMVIFVVLSYLLIDRGINTKTKLYVKYEDNYDISYKVYLNDKSNMNMNERYPSELVDSISFNLKYKSLFNRKVNGFYKYNVEGLLVIYDKDINDSIWQKKYILLDDVVNTLNSNGNAFFVEQNLTVDYKKYRNELLKVSKEFENNVNGYLELSFNIFENLDFVGIDNVKEDTKQAKIVIPLSYDYFRVNVISNRDNKDSYYDFSKKQSVNYALMIIGSFCLAVGISFFALVIRSIYYIYRNESKYNKKLKDLLRKYGDIIVKVKQFYNKKKYNLIYVESFDELLDVYDKVNKPISFREIKRNSDAIFLIVDDDNAWIYRMSVKDFE